MIIQRRYLVGGLVSALAIGGALAFDLIGPADPPDPLVLQFSRGTALVSGEEARLAAFAGRHVGEPLLDFHILGHTGNRGDADANLTLSQERADAVAAALVQAGVPQDRILSATGVGSADPLKVNTDESETGLQRRMARAVVTAVSRK